MFSHPRGRLPRMLFKPMKYYTFWGVLGAMGSLFEKKCVFIEFLQECGKSEKSWNFAFFNEKVEFHEKHDIAKTLIFTKEYPGLEPPDLQKSRIFINFMIVMKFHEIL